MISMQLQSVPCSPWSCYATVINLLLDMIGEAHLQVPVDSQRDINRCHKTVSVCLGCTPSAVLASFH